MSLWDPKTRFESQLSRMKEDCVRIIGDVSGNLGLVSGSGVGVAPRHLPAQKAAFRAWPSDA